MKGVGNSVHPPDTSSWLVRKKNETHQVHTPKKYPPWWVLECFAQLLPPNPCIIYRGYRWLHQWQETLRCQTWQNLGGRLIDRPPFFSPKKGGKCLFCLEKIEFWRVNDTQKKDIDIGKKSQNEEMDVFFWMWIQSGSMWTAKLQSFLTKNYPTMLQLFKNLGPTCLVNKEQVKHGRYWNCSTPPSQVEAKVKVPGWYNLDHFHPQCPKRFLHHIPGAEVTFWRVTIQLVSHVKNSCHEYHFRTGQITSKFFKTTKTYL